MAPDLVVALDVPTLADARRLTTLLSPLVRRFKVGLELYTVAGLAGVDAVRAAGGLVLLDLKIHDIPNTAAAAVHAAARLGVEMLTVHLAGGEAMARAAVDAAREEGTGLHLLGITRLTSDPATMGLTEVVAEEARRGQAWGFDGVVASPREAAAIRAACKPGFLIACPGVRPAGADAGDQARTSTPAEAARAGCDFVIVGRPIILHPDPAKAAAGILGEMSGLAAPA